MFVKLCEGCPREEICEERLCKSSWQREWLCSWDNIRRSGAKKRLPAWSDANSQRKTNRSAIGNMSLVTF